MDDAPDSDVLTEKSQENFKGAAPGLKDPKTSSDNSEYDSVDSYSDEDDQVVVKVRSKASGLDSHSGSEESVRLEREEGDGQESAPQKKVDDDEDKKNPQYIPKRGTFYEHDDRTAEDAGQNEEEPESGKGDKDTKKKVWQDKKEKWSHDRFNDQEQMPKSRSELIAIYGYDIRNEEGPPRARRRRRYGRGPNKYTRNWEDEDAYSKPPQSRPTRGSRKPRQKLGGDSNENEENSEEFPPLGGRRNNRSASPESNREEQDFKENDLQPRKSLERRDLKRDQQQQAVETNQSEQFKPTSKRQPLENSPSEHGRLSQPPNRLGTGRIVKPKREIKDSDYRGFTAKTRQERAKRSDTQKVPPPKGGYIQSQNFINKSSGANQIADLEKEINQLDIQDGVYKGGNKSGPMTVNQNRQGSVPPRLQAGEAKGSKRYSSMRQRSLPETATPPASAGFSFYPSDYNSTAPPPATQQPILPPPTLVAPQVPVSAAPAALLQTPFAPPTAFAAPPPPPAYMQAAPPPFIAAPPSQPQIVSYVTQAQPPFGFQGQFNPVTQPAELYQPQGGITYYSADQQMAQRATAFQKRPKAAIPIVAPIDFRDGQGEEFGGSDLQEKE
ncbi:protein CASC3 [Euwallacea similis]|uniref:protein CASC3 n=1 Tax=Euwallacea similis TaxID=1736056 RepID=UPI00344D996E